jgi:hypothetical protein
MDWDARTPGSSSASGRFQKASEKPVPAVRRSGNRLHSRAPAERPGDRLGGGKAGALDLQPLAKEFPLPVNQGIEREGQNHHGPARYPAQLGQAALGIPVVDRDAGHGRVDGIVVEGQRLGTGSDRALQVGRCARMVALGATASTQRSTGS